MISPVLRPIPGNLRQALFEKLGDSIPVLESRLFRYKQSYGLAQSTQKVSFIPRWCQVSKTQFSYFASGEAYAPYKSFPVCTIAIGDIKTVHRVHYQI